MRNGIPETFDELKVYMKNFHENLESIYPPDTPEEAKKKLDQFNNVKKSFQNYVSGFTEQYAQGKIDQEKYEFELRHHSYDFKSKVDISYQDKFEDFYWEVRENELEKAKERFLLNKFGDEVKDVISDIKIAEERRTPYEEKKKEVPVHRYHPLFEMLRKKPEDREKEGRKFVKVICPYAMGKVNENDPELEGQTLCSHYNDMKGCGTLAKYFGVEKPSGAVFVIGGGKGEVYRCTVSGEYLEFGGLRDAFMEIQETRERQKILREMKTMSRSPPREAGLLKRLSLNTSFEKLDSKFKGLVIGLMEKNAVDWYNTISVGDLKSIYDKK